MKICIIKLGALGDIIRTTPILEAIKDKYLNSEITWITKPESKEILENNPLIAKILTIPIENLDENFDILYSLDIDEKAIKLANLIKAKKKLGYYNNEDFPDCFNSGAEYYLNTAFDDSLKKSNRKTYQEMIFQASELKYTHQKCQIFLTEKEKLYGKEFLRKNNLKTGKIIGLNIGSSSRWPSKAWDLEKVKEFVIKIKKDNYELILLGGLNEQNILDNLIDNLKNQNIIVFQNNPNNSFKEFVSIINICDKIVCGDTMAIHIALSLNKPTIGLFFCTSPYEIESYGLLKKLVSPMLLDFFPEKSDKYNKTLVSSIIAEQVINAIKTNN